jgi:membrane protease YdiL (CAAX protease family)
VAKPLIEIAAVAAGMALFAVLAHHGLPWAVFGAASLLAVALIIGGSLRQAVAGAQLLGLRSARRGRAVLALGAALGVGAGLLHRHSMGQPLWPPGGWAGFAPVAALVGAGEELLYRGWLQGRARSLGPGVAVVLAAAAHTAYKTLLFAWPAVPVAIDYTGLALLTFAGGLVLGTLREAAGSVWPSVTAHAAFDLVVYGALAAAPWWVWR